MVRIAIVGGFGDDVARVALALDEFLRSQGHECSLLDANAGVIGPHDPRPLETEISRNLRPKRIDIRTFHANRLDDGSFPEIKSAFVAGADQSTESRR